jgi:hypothetical protein
VAILPPGSETVLTPLGPKAPGRPTKFPGRLIAGLPLPGKLLPCVAIGGRVFAGRAFGLTAGAGRFGGGGLFFFWLVWASAGTANKNKQGISQVLPLL